MRAAQPADLPYDAATLKSISDLVTDLLASVAELDTALGHEGGDTSMDHATYARDSLIPPMVKVRAATDALETRVADDSGPAHLPGDAAHPLIRT